jgi:hypothetical protein
MPDSLTGIDGRTFACSILFRAGFVAKSETKSTDAHFHKEIVVTIS